MKGQDGISPVRQPQAVVHLLDTSAERAAVRVTLGCAALTTWRAGRQEHVTATRHSGQDRQVGQGLITLRGMAGSMSLMNCLLLELSM